ncbi:helix-turn-helix domain-containing protein [Streptomyces sp. NPDC020802]|uniref:helix-turn-helix domain-containing protein n=1 Tax=Streptomyces sp. NPDC020802 TaxID=3365094 RepID=UPI0037B7D651
MLAIADDLRCNRKTVRRWLQRFNGSGLDGLEDLGGQGRKRRISEAERSRIIGLVKQAPPGRLIVQADGEPAAEDESGPPEWTLDALAAEARNLGIEVGRSQVRRILLAEGVRWRRTRSWTQVQRRGLRGKGTRIIELYTCPPEGATVVCADGQTRTTNSPIAAPVCVHPMRDPALAGGAGRAESDGLVRKVGEVDDAGVAAPGRHGAYDVGEVVGGAGGVYDSTRRVLQVNPRRTSSADHLASGELPAHAPSPGNALSTCRWYLPGDSSLTADQL